MCERAECVSERAECSRGREKYDGDEFSLPGPSWIFPQSGWTPAGFAADGTSPDGSLAGTIVVLASAARIIVIFGDSLRASLPRVRHVNGVTNLVFGLMRTVY